MSNPSEKVREEVRAEKSGPWRNKWMVQGHNAIIDENLRLSALTGASTIFDMRPDFPRDGEIIWSRPWPSREIAEQRARDCSNCAWDWLGAFEVDE